jgi:carbon monoxide dehydrogenase subunit G
LVDQRRFEARIAVGVGPFKIAYAGRGHIVASNPKRRTASLTLDGRSFGTMPAVHVRMTMAIQRRRCGSSIRMAFTIGVSDRGGLLTQGWLDLIARELVDRTISRIKRQLEDDPGPPHADAA